MARLRNQDKQYALFGAYCLFLLLAACSPTATPTPFIPPTDSNTQPIVITSVVFATSTPLSQSSSQSVGTQSSAASAGSSSAAAVSPSPSACASNCPGCTNSLKFVEDITIPDGTVVSAGQAIDKQWRVQNDGSCDWGSGYVLKLVSGDAMGTPAETALYPALAGAQAVIDMPLTAPQTAGSYHTVWQAFAPDGTAFDQPIYVDIVVQ